MNETKVIYHIDDEETPYLVKLPVDPENVTLGDFKSVVLNQRLLNNATNSSENPPFKFFFKSKDDDFGVVKEEILDDSAKLPLFNGRVVAWLVSSSEGSILNDGPPSEIPSDLERGPGVGQTRPPSFHGGGGGAGVGASSVRSRNLEDVGTELTEDGEEDGDDVFDDDTESNITSVSQAARRERRRIELEQRMRRGLRYRGGHAANTDTTSSMMSSEIESSIYDDTEDAASMASSRFTTSTDHTSVSRNMLRQRQKKKLSRRKMPTNLERAGSISSVTDSTLSLNIMTVTLNMDTVNFLGISIVGQSNKHGDGDCGIYVGSIMKGGAVALDGRIDPGDMILQVNDINFENMSNDDAVRVLREVVQKPGPIKLVIAKCWDPSPKGYFTIPRTEPVRPIDPGAWVAHTAAVRGLEVPQPPPSFVDGPTSNISYRLGDFALTPTYSHLIPHPPIIGEFGGRAPSVTTLSASSIVSSQPETEKYVPINRPGGVGAPSVINNEPLNINSGMNLIVRAMGKPDSGLEVRDRLWLKITISKAFIGSDVVDWLFNHVEGFSDRREARKYAAQMLKNNFIKHAVNKTSFSEQCYYVFGANPAVGTSDLPENMNAMKLSDNNSSNATPTPPMSTGGIWVGGPTGAGGPPPTGPPPPLPSWQPGTIPPNTSVNLDYSTNPTIYNPSAPPPSANYMQLPYGSENSYTTFQPPPSVSSSGGSSQPSQHKLRLAASGSGSDSDADRRIRLVAGGPALPPVTSGSAGIENLTVNNVPMSMRPHSQENMIQPTPIYQAQ